MPKRSINDYKPLGIKPLYEHSYYSSEDINNIIDAAGGLRDGEVEIESFNDGGEAVTVRRSCRDGLIAELENLANSYSVFSELQTSPTAKQKVAAFEEIDDAACDLLLALSLPEDRPKGNLLDYVPTALTYSALPDFGMNLLHFATPKGGNSLEGRKRLREAIEGVYRLKDWAGQARRAALQHPPTGRSERHPGDPSLDSWIKGLGGVTVQAFEQAAVAREAEDLKEAFEERAGIFEFDAGLPRVDAKREAAKITATYARNARYLWALSAYPEFLASLPDQGRPGGLPTAGRIQGRRACRPAGAEARGIHERA